MVVVVMFSGVIKNIRADWLYSAQPRIYKSCFSTTSPSHTSPCRRQYCTDGASWKQRIQFYPLVNAAVQKSSSYIFFHYVVIFPITLKSFLRKEVLFLF